VRPTDESLHPVYSYKTTQWWISSKFKGGVATGESLHTTYNYGKITHWWIFSRPTDSEALHLM